MLTLIHLHMIAFAYDCITIMHMIECILCIK